MAVCDFVLIDTRSQLRDAFPLLDEGVEAVEERLPKRECVAADLYAAALAGDVDVFLVRADQEVIGFMAVQASFDLAGNKALHVWILYLRPGGPDVMAEVVEELDFLAGSAGCTEVSFFTVRPAWERRLSRYGYAPRAVVFTKEVPHG